MSYSTGDTQESALNPATARQTAKSSVMRLQGERGAKRIWRTYTRVTTVFTKTVQPTTWTCTTTDHLLGDTGESSRHLLVSPSSLALQRVQSIYRFVQEYVIAHNTTKKVRDPHEKKREQNLTAYKPTCTEQCSYKQSRQNTCWLLQLTVNASSGGMSDKQIGHLDGPARVRAWLFSRFKKRNRRNNKTQK